MSASSSSRRACAWRRVARGSARRARRADRGELADRRLVAVREVRVAVAELLGEVELEPLGERRASLGGGAVEEKRSSISSGAAQVALAVPAPLGLAALERRAAADRDEDVLQERAPRVVRVDVAGRDRLDAEVLGEVAQEPEAPRVSPLERPLELDVEALAAERAARRAAAFGIEEPEPAPRAAGEADEPLVRARRRPRAAPTAAAAPGPRGRRVASPRARP